MKTRAFLLMTVLAMMVAGTALAQETPDEETKPEANTVFVATVDDETNAIKYHVCSLNDAADTECATLLDGFDAETFAWLNEIEVTPNGDGEFNHGSFVSAFAQGYDGTGKGCILRFIAQSDWGKEGADPAADPLIEAETFCAFNADRGGDGNGNGKPAWAGQGKPPWAGPDGDKSLRPGKGGGNSGG